MAAGTERDRLRARSSERAPPPGPDLRADVLDGANAVRLQTWRDLQVELLRVDADVNIGPLRQHARKQLAANAQQPRQMRQDLEQPHDREIVGALPGFAAGRNHPRPGDALRTARRARGAQRFDQVCAEIVARGFAGDENDARASWPPPNARSRPAPPRRGIVEERDQRRQLRLRGRTLIELLGCLVQLQLRAIQDPVASRMLRICSAV